MKVNEKFFYSPLVLMLVSAIIKWLHLPNQIIPLSIGLLLMLICLVLFLKKQLLMKTVYDKTIHLLVFLLVLLVFFLPFIGMFQQKMLPLLIYAIMALVIVFYFKKISRNHKSTHNYLQPTSYRNFVYQSYCLVLLNIPIATVLPDYFYMPAFQPKYGNNLGPTIYVDEAHNNYHTIDGLYKTFANVLRQDGYCVKPSNKKLTNPYLQQINLLVISNALNEANVDSWEQPVFEALEDSEIEAINQWVRSGGSLLLIADHTPFSSATKKLAASFGFVFSDGFAKQKNRKGNDLFCRHQNMLSDNEITNGYGQGQYVDSIITFYGQAFQIPDSAISILNFNDEYVQYSPKVGEAMKSCKPEPINGYAQGAYMKYGLGRIVVFGEAAMFSGQLGLGLSWEKVGMNTAAAKNNYKLLLNIIHWLDLEKK